MSRCASRAVLSLPQQQLKAVLEQYPDAELVWVQE
jgi:hypothetical protein